MCFRTYVTVSDCNMLSTGQASAAINNHYQLPSQRATDVTCCKLPSHLSLYQSLSIALRLYQPFSIFFPFLNNFLYGVHAAGHQAWRQAPSPTVLFSRPLSQRSALRTLYIFSINLHCSYYCELFMPCTFYKNKL